MTDEQIEKALQLCSSNDFECCDDCPIAEDIKEDCRCGSFLAENALGYIKRLKEKNQKLEQEIENKLENGQLLEIPCKIGSVIYLVYERPDKTHNKYWLMKKSRLTAQNLLKVAQGWGEYAFATEEEAKSKLRVLQGRFI